MVRYVLCGFRLFRDRQSAEEVSDDIFDEAWWSAALRRVDVTTWTGAFTYIRFYSLL